MIEIASNPEYEVNHKEKHSRGAKLGWYRYDTRFALPVFNERGEIDRFNVFNARLPAQLQMLLQTSMVKPLHLYLKQMEQLLRVQLMLLMLLMVL